MCMGIRGGKGRGQEGGRGKIKVKVNFLISGLSS